VFWLVCYISSLLSDAFQGGLMTNLSLFQNCLLRSLLVVCKEFYDFQLTLKLLEENILSSLLHQHS
jgi:hypothetical protein